MPDLCIDQLGMHRGQDHGARSTAVLSVCMRLQLRRTTFHDFMLDVHYRLHQQERTTDPLTLVAAQLVSEFKVLCLDEFFVTDVADATMLNRLFSQMWERGLVFVATSNRFSPTALLYR